MGEQMAYERIEEMLAFQNKWQWIGYIFLPIFIAVKAFTCGFMPTRRGYLGRV